MCVALGCMRLSTDEDRDEARAEATLEAALDAGIRTFDTARAYARDDGELGHNERLVARVLRRRGASDARIVTKGGMRRPMGGWEPDGRARTLRADCEASLEALEGVPVDLYLLHAPDPRVPWLTSVRALARLVEEKLVRRIGLSNVTRRQLDEALAVAPIAAVQVALGPFADAALRGGVVARCIELGLEVLAHTPLGGPGRAGRLARHAELAAIASRHGVTPQRAALAALADLHERIVPVAGARRPETVRAYVAPVTLDDDDRRTLEQRYGWRAILWPPAASQATDGELVLVMGIQGAGKSSAVAPWVERGYVRANRDEAGGTLRALHEALDARIAAGARTVVADNTYVTRAARQGAIALARRHGLRATGLWLDTPLAEAQRNVVERMLQAHGRLLEPDEMERARDPASIGPGAMQRLVRQIEPPEVAEGFASLEVVPFVRLPRPGHDGAATFVTLDAAERGMRPAGGLAFVIGWMPDATDEWIARAEPRFGAPVRGCRHPGGPSRCWCRPPMPGLILELAQKNRLDPAACTVIGTSHVHERMARSVGATFRAV